MRDFFWALVIWLVLRAVRVGTLGAWLTAGAAAGVGLENKSTVAVLVAGLVVGLIAQRRSALRGPYPWLGGAFAALLYKVITSTQVLDLLTGVVSRALHVPF